MLRLNDLGGNLETSADLCLAGMQAYKPCLGCKSDFLIGGAVSVQSEADLRNADVTPPAALPELDEVKPSRREHITLTQWVEQSRRWAIANMEKRGHNETCRPVESCIGGRQAQPCGLHGAAKGGAQ